MVRGPRLLGQLRSRIDGRPAFVQRRSTFGSISSSPYSGRRAEVGQGADFHDHGYHEEQQRGRCVPGTTNTRFWLSSNNVLDGGDTLLATRPVPSLNPGATSAGSTSATIALSTPPGSYFLIAKADADGSISESNEGNNLRTKAITILGSDLTVWP